MRLTISTRHVHRATLYGAVALSAALLCGCAVISVAGIAVGVAATGAGLAVDAAVGTVKLTGKAIGAAADLVIPDGDK